MKLKVLFSGIDGTGKTTCLDLVVDRLEADHRVLRVGGSAYFLSFQGVREPLISRKLQRRIFGIGRVADRVHLYGIYLIFNFLFKFISSRYFQFSRKADVVMLETDTLLHPAVVITYHFPWLRRLSPKWRFRTASALFGSRRNTLIVYFEADPAVSVQRILQREILSGTEVQPHENLEDLKMLEQEFEAVLRVASEAGYDVVRVDTNERSAEQVAKEVEAELRKRLEPERAPSEALSDRPTSA
jgi:thymidylate kinase